MKNFIILVLGMTAINFLINWPAVNQALAGYEDYITALVFAALISPFIVPLFD